jgi:hypothetical protein
MRKSTILLSLLWGTVLILAGCAGSGSKPAAAPQGPAPAAKATQPPAPPAAGKAPAYKQGDRLTAYEAYQVLLPKVREWQPQATIALGTWQISGAEGGQGADGRSSTWRFICASPDEQAYASFELNTTKEPERQVRVATTNVRRPGVTALVDPAAWKVDSAQALEIAQANGLQQWLAEHPKHQWGEATLELRASAEEGAYWLVVAHEGQGTSEFRISAADSKVLHARSH